MGEGDTVAKIYQYNEGNLKVVGKLDFGIMPNCLLIWNDTIIVGFQDQIKIYKLSGVNLLPELFAKLVEESSDRDGLGSDSFKDVYAMDT